MEKKKIIEKCRKCGADSCSYCQWCSECDNGIRHGAVCTRPKKESKKELPRDMNFQAYAVQINKQDNLVLLIPNDVLFCDDCGGILTEAAFLQVYKWGRRTPPQYNIYCMNDTKAIKDINGVYEFVSMVRILKELPHEFKKKAHPIFNLTEIEFKTKKGDTSLGIVDLSDITDNDINHCRLAGRAVTQLGIREYEEAKLQYQSRENELNKNLTLFQIEKSLVRIQDSIPLLPHDETEKLEFQDQKLLE